MQKILIVGSRSTDDGETEALQRLAEFVTASLQTVAVQADVAFCHLDEVGYVIDSSATAIHDFRNQLLIDDYDLLLFRGKLRAVMNDVALIASYADQKGIAAVNTAHVQRRATGKVPQAFQMQRLQLPFPTTVSSSARYLPQLIEEHLSYPVIVKDIHGAHGNNNFLVHDSSELADILGDNPGITFLAQTMIPNEGDYRLLIAGSQLAIIRRQGAADSHLNNTSQGGAASLVANADFPQTIIDQARQFASDCQYELAGVDAIIDKNSGEHYFLEINSQPQIASGAFVDEKSILIGQFLQDVLAD